eukprot:CAMPEP_0118664342 /NCGR_PEP_ID=MMETSP0785-20121206/17952_1 /TAXON_ID=91992 /ORGANISM="Bolidomonas pacifica, Strain CCMP 1866" /LENGTH=139 /DNA_ID=CAMNT_0006558223 /DNA_START=19 /DNA_END=435 /DNA_ORIENTATION=-
MFHRAVVRLVRNTQRRAYHALRVSKIGPPTEVAKYHNEEGQESPDTPSTSAPLECISPPPYMVNRPSEEDPLLYFLDEERPFETMLARSGLHQHPNFSSWCGRRIKDFMVQKRTLESGLDVKQTFRMKDELLMDVVVDP